MLTDTQHNSQPLRALEEANRVRTARANEKAALRAGSLTLPEVLADPPDALGDLALWELLLLAHKIGRQRIAKINRCAIHADVNLAVPLARASTRTREWLTAALLDPQATERRIEPAAEVLEADPRTEQLAQAIAEHQRAIRGPGPTSDFGVADDLLYHRCADIMAVGDETRPRDEPLPPSEPAPVPLEASNEAEEGRAAAPPRPLDEDEAVSTDVTTGRERDTVTIGVPARKGVIVETFIRCALGGAAEAAIADER